MRSLFEIGDDLFALGEMLEEVGGEITEDEAGEALERWFEQLGAERDKKIDGYCLLIRQFEAASEARELEAKRLMALAGADGNNARRLKDRLKRFFDAQGIAKLETPRFKLSIQKNGGKAPLVVPQAWEQEPAAAPEAYQRRVIQLDKEAIREALEAGEQVDGCEIAPRGSHLRIR